MAEKYGSLPATAYLCMKNGALKLKRGDELRLNDRLAAPARIRFPSDAPSRIDLLRKLHAVPSASKQIWVRGPAVEAWFKANVIDVIERHPS